jgi:hypothetical protein
MIDETLTAEQRKRLRQIEVQGMGLDVFVDIAKAGENFNSPFGVRGATVSQVAIHKEAQAALKLTETQKTSVKAIVEGFTTNRRAIMKTTGFGNKAGQVPLAEAQKTVDKARKDAWEKIEELLDADQKKTLKELVGEPSGFGKSRFP